MARPSKENLDMVTRIIRITGLLFIAAGFVFAWFPDKLDDYIGDMSADDSRFIGIALIIVGMIDLLIIPRIFEKQKQIEKK